MKLEIIKNKVVWVRKDGTISIVPAKCKKILREVIAGDPLKDEVILEKTVATGDNWYGVYAVFKNPYSSILLNNAQIKIAKRLIEKGAKPGVIRVAIELLAN